MSPLDPWAALAARPDVDLVWADLPRGVRGLTDGVGTIWLDRGLSQRERRCTLAHELIHLERGHKGAQPASVEADVNAEAARRLLPDLGTIGRALAWARTLDEAAHELWVTREILAARLDALDDSERAHLHPLDAVRAS